MRSGTVLDRQSSASDDAVVRDLLVLWQHPDTHEIIPIGRFGHYGVTYTFAYTRAAATIADFRLLPGLSDLHGRYESDVIPAVFGQRVMDRHRPDFDAHVDAPTPSGFAFDPQRQWEPLVGR